MLIWELWLVALAAIRANKLRSFLTMLGIVIGVGCVIAVVVFQFLFGISLLSIVMTPFFEPASLISLNACVGYGIPNLTFLFPCLL